MTVNRVLVTTQVTLLRTFVVDETPTDAAGAVTVTVKRLDGTVVITGPATSAGVGKGSYTFVLPAQPAVDVLTVDWSGDIGGATVTVRDIAEVVGGFVFGLPETRTEHKSLTKVAYPTSVLAQKRIWVEQECERICRRAMVPRFARVACDGSGTAMLLTPHLLLRKVRAVTVGATVWTSDQIANVIPRDSGVLLLKAGVWPLGYANVIVEMEHGEDLPPMEVSEAAITRFRSAVSGNKSNIPDRALSYTVMQGGVYRLATPTSETTGIPTVDAAYHGNRLDSGGFA